MRILHLTSHLRVGGVARSVVTTARCLRGRGHTVAVAAEDGPLQAELSAARCDYWPAALGTSAEFSPSVFAATRALADRLRKEPVDVLHAHTRTSQVAAARLSKKLRIPYVATWHGFFRPNLGRRLWPCTGDLSIAISPPVAEHLKQDFHVPEDRIRLVPHGIDARLFSPGGQAERDRLRSDFGLSTQGPVVGTVTRLIRARAIDQLLDAWQHLLKAVPGAQLLIVGEGEDRERLLALAATLLQKDRIHFVPTVNVTREALSVMDVFVFLPADKEGFGLVLLEAMAAERPVVAIRRGGGSTWLLDESGAGAQVKAQDPQGLAAAIASILQDPARAAVMASQGLAVVRSRYALDGMTDRLERVYAEASGRWK